MPRALEQLEDEVLKLPNEARVHLMQRLLQSFQETRELDPTIAREWLEEAERRDRAMEREGDSGVPAEEVFQR
ncbi:MAG: addiction module protein [Acidobacteriota bacterium]|jgi:hypothetical protein